MVRENHMRRAIAMSRREIRTNRGFPFGAVIVKDGGVVAEAHNTVLSENDPTAHAGITAIRAASAKLGTLSLASAGRRDDGAICCRYYESRIEPGEHPRTAQLAFGTRHVPRAAAEHFPVHHRTDK